MRADRLLHLLLLLQQSDKMTSRQLASRLEVSERTIHRDMEALSASGIPVVADRGTGGGWYLHPGYKSFLTGINREDIRTLLLPQLTGAGYDPAWKEAFSAASRKLLAALPPDWRKDAEEVRRRIHADGVGWYGDNDGEAEQAARSLRQLQDAIWAGRRVHFVYNREDGPVERTVHPWELVVKGSIWYLVAKAAETGSPDAGTDGSIRTYRVSRIGSVRLLEDTAGGPPQGFDLAAYWESSVNRFKELLPVYPAVLQTDPATLARLRNTRFVHVDQTEETGHVPLRVHVQFHTLEHAAAVLLGFAGEAVVLEPEELRLHITAAARRILEAYGSPSPAF